MFLILAYFVKVTVCCNQTTLHLAKHLYTVNLNLVYGATQMCFKNIYFSLTKHFVSRKYFFNLKTIYMFLWYIYFYTDKYCNLYNGLVQRNKGHFILMFGKGMFKKEDNFSKENSK